LREVIERILTDQPYPKNRFILEHWTKLSQSNLIWAFNNAYWDHVLRYQAAHGKNYQDAIKGSPDNLPEFVEFVTRKFLLQLKRYWSSEGVKDVYYMEYGAAGQFFTQEFTRQVFALADKYWLDPEDIRKHVTYVLADPSKATIAKSKETLQGNTNGLDIEFVVFDPNDPFAELQKHYKDKTVLRARVTNVFELFRVDPLIKRGDEHLGVEVEFYIDEQLIKTLSKEYHIPEKQLREDLLTLTINRAHKPLDTGVADFIYYYDQLFKGRGKKKAKEEGEEAGQKEADRF